jgi:hypothetical protein
MGNLVGSRYNSNRPGSFGTTVARWGLTVRFGGRLLIGARFLWSVSRF